MLKNLTDPLLLNGYEIGNIDFFGLHVLQKCSEYLVEVHSEHLSSSRRLRLELLT